MKKFFTIIMLAGLPALAQNSRPKLVVAVVVDQMRSDYISRYWDRFGKGGFRRLVEQGYNFRNTHYNYIPTYTGPGHASIFTGTTPRTHGIIANDWFEKSTGKTVYCVQDEQVQSTGTESPAGKASPARLLSSTIGDELKMSSNGRSKVFAVAIKDRSAVLPAGHAANGAFWMDDKDGKFVTSSWYMKTLPAWVEDFNNRKLAQAYLKNGWTTLYPVQSYTNSIADNNNYENSPFGPAPVFPHNLDKYTGAGNFSTIKGTPFGSSITKDLAITCIRKESLGKDEFPDLLSISFSSPDHIAHTFGPRSVEVEDTYLRLDKDLEELMLVLDNEVGKDQYVLFLTADHGGADNPTHLLDNKIPAGYLTDGALRGMLKEFFKNNYGDTSLLSDVNNAQVYLDEKKIIQKNLQLGEVEERCSGFLRGIPGISEVYSSTTLRNGGFPATDYRALLQNGYSHARSGNICYILQPAWMDNAPKGTTHGAGYNYDTHVPLLFFGSGIHKGENFDHVPVTSIAPTISELLLIPQPNSCASIPLNNYFK